MGTEFASANDLITCRVCGTENGTFYTYCRRCLGHLPASATS
ncbi:DUF7577 domain-containing protein [Natrinema marinum]